MRKFTALENCAARTTPKQFAGRTDVDMSSVLRTAPSDHAHIHRQCSENSNQKVSWQSHPPQRAQFLVIGFWHGCTNKLRFIQVTTQGSRCYCCISTARQTANSLYRPFPPERPCNEGVIGLITLCLPIMLLK